MYKEETVLENVIDERPDFCRIIDALQNENSKGEDNALLLNQLANFLKPIERKPMDGELLDKSPICLVDHLWNEVFKLRKINKDIHEAIIHFRTVIPY